MYVYEPTLGAPTTTMFRVLVIGTESLLKYDTSEHVMN